MKRELFYYGVDILEDGKQCRQFVERDRVGAVAERLLRVFMNLHKDAVDSGGNGCAREMSDELALSA